MRPGHDDVLPPASAYLLRRAAAGLDHALLRAMMSDDRIPRPSDVDPVTVEVQRAVSYLDETGVLAEPRRFHQTPQTPMTVRSQSRRLFALRYEHLSFDSGYEPIPDMPGADRWRSIRSNHRMHAWVLRHPTPRPWIICIPGLGMGSAWMDLPAFHSAELHHRRGLNVVLPVLPLHGQRCPPGMGRGEMMSYQVLDTVHAVAQSVWDVRRLIAWARAEGAEQIGLHGLSIGAYVASIVSGFEPAELLMAGIPVADIPRLYTGHTPAHLAEWLATREPPREHLDALFSVVSPNSFAPLVPVSRRYIYAGKVDRITPPTQATLLWEAWEHPTIRWFEGGHMSFRWSSEVRAFVARALTRTGFHVTQRAA